MSAGQLSLYIDLEDGRKADLEVVARASLAYAAAIRSIAVFIDPFSDIRVDLIDSIESSLSLNTKIKFKTASGVVETSIYALILVFMAYLGTHIGDLVLDKALTALYEKIFGTETTSVSEADKTDIVNRSVKALEAKAGERQVKQIYAELDQDGAIRGLGLSKTPGERPEYIVPKSEFAWRSGVIKAPEPVELQRPRREILNAILVSPVLVNDRKRRWKFKVGDNEFGAPIRDDIFLDAVFSGKHPIIMKGNIHMRIALGWNEDFVDGVWFPKDYVVWSVVEVPGQYQGPQELLPFDYRPETDRKPKKRKTERSNRTD